MPLAAIAIAKELWSLRYLILSIAVIGVFTWYTLHERNIGAAKCLAAVEQATAQEHERRDQVLTYMQQWAQGATKHVTDLEKSNAALAQRTKILSAAADGHMCYDADAVSRLNGVQH